MNYLGENLYPAYIGHLSAIISFVAVALSCIAYYLSFKNKEDIHWKKLARYSFITHFIFVFIQFVVLFYVIYNHLFEYKYAYLHSDKQLSFQYLLSCFWEGQEGSFLLWLFWQSVLGIVLIKVAKKWETTTMFVLGFIQILLSLMLVGIYIADFKIGLNAFGLLRDEMNWPILSKPDYLLYIKDGTGLNTLLQNYWMVIHPPILFLGFASLVIPFCFVVAGLIKNDHSWTKPVLPFTNFGIGIFGLGIMMGAAWAYESLSFGGYWAWDPVENASLVPWIMLVASLHTNLIYNKTSRSLRITYLFYGLSYLLIIYSTFLTRSGILGDTSVHAFTDLGMNTQLLLFVALITTPFLILYFYRYKKIPSIHTEESISSREFWMLIAALLLCIASLIIIGKTSLPVFNKIFNTKIAPPEDNIYSYNQILIIIALLIGFIISFTQFLKYNKTQFSTIKKNIQYPIIISILISIPIFYIYKIIYTQKGLVYFILIYITIFASICTLVFNTWYLIKIVKNKLQIMGASIAHIGFGMILFSILISSANKKVISHVSILSDKNTNVENNENITLFEGIPIQMRDFTVNYVGDSFNEKNKQKIFQLKFVNNFTKKSFTIYPNVMKNNKGGEGYAANPDSKHYWYKDIFVYLTSFQDNKQLNAEKYAEFNIKKKDTIFYTNGFIQLDSIAILNINDNPLNKKIIFSFKLQNKYQQNYVVNPSIELINNQLYVYPDSIQNENIKLRFKKIVDQEKGSFAFEMVDNNLSKNMITVKVYEFPLINFLWLGVIIMVIGSFIAVLGRIKNKHII